MPENQASRRLIFYTPQLVVVFVLGMAAGAMLTIILLFI
jgi:hypothetical protein